MDLTIDHQSPFQIADRLLELSFFYAATSGDFANAAKQYHAALDNQPEMTELYDSLSEARHEVGEDVVPFHKFAELVKGQVQKLRESGNDEVAFRVGVKNGKVSFTARALKGVSE